jgi:hypothetical protein
MTQNLKIAEQMVVHLIAETNRDHYEAQWSYELTSDVSNIEVVSAAGTNTLRIHPCWLRYVVAQGDFKSCVGDEITAWYLLAQATGAASVATAA